MNSRATIAALTVGATLFLSGCSFAADVTTSNEYDPSDGLGTTVGAISTENFLLVSEGEGEPAVLVGSLYNSNRDEALKVTLTLGETTETVVIDPLTKVLFGVNDNATEVLTVSPANPGGLAEVTIGVEGESAETKLIPVLDGTLPEYAAVLEQLKASQD